MITAIKGFVKGKLAGISSVALMVCLMMFAAVPAFAANQQLDDATKELTTGVGDMLLNAIIVITACIGVVVVVFGIGWLIGIAKRNMSKA